MVKMQKKWSGAASYPGTSRGGVVGAAEKVVVVLGRLKEDRVIGRGRDS